MKSPLEICAVLTVSSCHITEIDGEIMLEDASPVLMAAASGEQALFLADLPFADSFQDSGYSPAFGKLLKLARDNGCALLRIHADGPTVPGLPTFDW